VSDSDNDVGSASESAAPDTAEPKASNDSATSRRAFRSWSPARGDDAHPSVITRMRASLASLFSPKAQPVTPPDDFEFPWARGAETLAAPDRSTPDNGNAAGDTAPPADPIDLAFASLDEALPPADNAPPAAATAHPEFATTLPPEPPRESFIVRLLGKTDAAPKPKPKAPVSDSSSTIEFEPLAAVTLFGDTPGNRDLADRADALANKTDAFDVVTEPLGEDPTELLPQAPRPALLERLLFWRKRKVVAAPASAAPAVDAKATFLFAKFRTFYSEIIRFKHQKTEFTAGFSTAIMSEASASEGTPEAAAALGKKLMELLELQAAEAKWMGGELGARYPEAQYAMAALADEIFTQLEWEGQSHWANHTLEFELYRTRGAAHELFKRIDRLLKDAPNSAIARDLARVYLQVLAGGFKGKYREFGLTRALAEYRQRLYEFIYRDDALLLYAPDRKIFPTASARTLEGHAVSRFSAAQRWAAILAFVAIGYAVVAHVAWRRVSADLQDVTSRIVADSTSGTR
jgi:type IV/VI secretion system ImpK/VasF family protein